MEKINLMLLISMLLFSYSQVSKPDLPLNYPRKLANFQNETILLGYENYNILTKDGDTWARFDTYYLLKNWEDVESGFMQNPEYEYIYTLESRIFYKDHNKSTNFTCKNDKKDYYQKLDYDHDPDYYTRYNIIKYRCEANITGEGKPTKINITTNYTGKIHLNGTSVSYISSSAEALEKDLINLKYATKEFFYIWKNVTFISQSPTYFKMRGNDNVPYNSENIQLITTVNGYPKKIQCSGKKSEDKKEDEEYYYLETKGSNNIAGADLHYSLLNYTTKQDIVIIDFLEGINGTIKQPNVIKKKSEGLSTGGIIAIVIPSIVVLLGVAGLAFFLSRRAIPPPPVKNMVNNTIGVASSEAIVHQ